MINLGLAIAFIDFQIYLNNNILIKFYLYCLFSNLKHQRSLRQVILLNPEDQGQCLAPFFHH